MDMIGTSKLIGWELAWDTIKIRGLVLKITQGLLVYLIVGQFSRKGFTGNPPSPVQKCAKKLCEIITSYHSARFLRGLLLSSPSICCVVQRWARWFFRGWDKNQDFGIFKKWIKQESRIWKSSRISAVKNHDF